MARKQAPLRSEHPPRCANECTEVKQPQIRLAGMERLELDHCRTARCMHVSRC